MKNNRKASIHLPNTLTSRTAEPVEEQISPQFRALRPIEAAEPEESPPPRSRFATSRHHADVHYVRLPSISQFISNNILPRTSTRLRDYWEVVVRNDSYKMMLPFPEAIARLGCTQ